MTKAKLLSWEDLTTEEQEEMRESITRWWNLCCIDPAKENIEQYYFWKDKDGFLSFSRNF